MKLFSIFKKTLREMVRDPLLLLLSLIFAPMFVLAYWGFFPEGSTSYDLIVINRDQSVRLSTGLRVSGGEQAIEALRGLTYEDGSPMLKVSTLDEQAAGEVRLQNRDAEAILVIPETFSSVLVYLQDSTQQNGHSIEPGEAPTATLTYIGDLTNPYYPVAMALSGSVMDRFILDASGRVNPISYAEIPLGASSARSEFDIYVPGLMIFAVTMLIYMAAMLVTREVESGTLQRLQITRIKSFHLVGGMTGALVLIGILEVLLTILTALTLGFRSQGPLWIAVAAGALTSFSVIGVGMITACFAKNVNQAFLLANFPLGIFMFFSGAIFPMQHSSLISIGSYSFGLPDLLPPTHAVNILNKVLTMGVGFQEVLPEFIFLTVLSAVYFSLGVWLFGKRQIGG